jgi:hypothetical protein
VNTRKICAPSRKLFDGTRLQRHAGVAVILMIVMGAACSGRPRAEPSKAELVGKYALTEIPAARRSQTSTDGPAATVQLEADGSFEIDGLPSCFADDRAPSKRLTGTIAGQWSVTQLQGEYVLELLVKSGPLQHGWNLGVEIRGRAAPFELYFVVGDPDTGTELVFSRSS